ncbi:hypothetical protein HRbin30_00577 [bacterium HR30]|nr:hypothetical protein HRbin30_00577 [bacterium HR30]
MLALLWPVENSAIQTVAQLRFRVPVAGTNACEENFAVSPSNPGRKLVGGESPSLFHSLLPRAVQGPQMTSSTTLWLPSLALRREKPNASVALLSLPTLSQCPRQRIGFIDPKHTERPRPLSTFALAAAAAWFRPTSVLSPANGHFVRQGLGCWYAPGGFFRKLIARRSNFHRRSLLALYRRKPAHAQDEDDFRQEAHVAPFFSRFGVREQIPPLQPPTGTRRVPAELAPTPPPIARVHRNPLEPTRQSQSQRQ